MCYVGRCIKMNDNAIMTKRKYGEEIYDLGEKPFDVES